MHACRMLAIGLETLKTEAAGSVVSSKSGTWLAADSLACHFSRFPQCLSRTRGTALVFLSECCAILHQRLSPNGRLLVANHSMPACHLTVLVQLLLASKVQAGTAQLQLEHQTTSTPHCRQKPK
jgi:hypothetical protein